MLAKCWLIGLSYSVSDVLDKFHIFESSYPNVRVSLPRAYPWRAFVEFLNGIRSHTGYLINTNEVKDVHALTNSYKGINILFKLVFMLLY